MQSHSTSRLPRGKLHVAFVGDDGTELAAFVCTDRLTACALLSPHRRGSIHVVKPGEGRELREYLVGRRPSPFEPLPTVAWQGSIIDALREEVEISKPHARRTVLKVMREHAGIGWALFETGRLIKSCGSVT